MSKRNDKTPNHKDWEIVLVADNEPLAELTEQRLEAAKIPVVLVPGDASAYLGASSPFAVKVPADQLEKAREILSD